MLVESSDVKFRHLAFQKTAFGDISGICLAYQSKTDAESLFDFIHQYLSASGSIPRRLIDVKAMRETSDSYTFTIELGLGDRLRRIQIFGVAKEYIDKIRRSLKNFTYYMVAASYDLEDGKIDLLSLSENHLFLNRITIDNKRYTGNPNCSFPWSELVKTEHIVYQSNE